jgi:hypothetical protein
MIIGRRGQLLTLLALLAVLLVALAGCDADCLTPGFC